MSINTSKPISGTEERIDRAYHIDVVTPSHQSFGNYSWTIRREEIRLINGVKVSASKIPRPVVLGDRVGDEFPDADPGFIPQIEFTVAEVASMPEEITVEWNGTVVPANKMPGLIQDLVNYLAKKRLDDRLAAEIAQALGE